MTYKVLWTGGWDSTFRILDLVLNKQKTVQPYYVLDKGRKSTKIELETIEKIKQAIYKKDKNAKGRIKDTILIEIKDIPQVENITKAYNNLANSSHLGKQYDWLARYASTEGLTNLELSIHYDDKAEGFIREDVQKVVYENDSYYKLKINDNNLDLFIFSYFTFPLLDLTKTRMGEIAEESNFNDIMEMTWFCHRPYKGKPCGVCNPCLYTKEEGLSRRVPKPSLIVLFLRKSELIFKKIFLRKSKAIFKKIIKI